MRAAAATIILAALLPGLAAPEPAAASPELVALLEAHLAQGAPVSDIPGLVRPTAAEAAAACIAGPPSLCAFHDPSAALALACPAGVRCDPAPPGLDPLRIARVLALGEGIASAPDRAAAPAIVRQLDRDRRIVSSALRSGGGAALAALSGPAEPFSGSAVDAAPPFPLSTDPAQLERALARCDGQAIASSAPPFAAVPVDLPDELRRADAYVAALVLTGGAAHSAPVVRTGDGGAQFRAPVHPAGAEGGDALVLLVDVGGPDAPRTLCPPMPFRVAPSSARPGAFVAMTERLAGLYPLANAAAARLGQDLPFTADDLSAMDAIVADLVDAYEAADANERVVLDLVAHDNPLDTAAGRFAAALSPLPERRPSDGRRGGFAPGGARLWQASVLPDTTGLPDALSDACPATPAMLTNHLRLGAYARIGQAPEQQLLLAGAQVSAATSAKLALAAYGKASEKTFQAVDVAVGTGFAVYGLAADLLAGMMPSELVELDVETSPTTLYEDAADQVFEIRRVYLHTASAGWDKKKAVMDIALATYGAFQGQMPAGALASKTFGVKPQNALTDPAFMRAVRQTSAGSGGTLDRALAETVGREASRRVDGEIIQATLGFAAGQLDAKFMGLVAGGPVTAEGRSFGVQRSFCRIDMTREPYTRSESDRWEVLSPTERFRYAAGETGTANVTVHLNPDPALLPVPQGTPLPDARITGSASASLRPCFGMRAGRSIC